MARSPCCSKEGLTRGSWTAVEDKILVDYITHHGEGKWKNITKFSGLKRCGKSCRLRWLNYLRPDIKRGNILPEEEDLIVRLHKLLGNRWCLIAGRLPGRTDNEIKNYWNTILRKKVKVDESNQNIHTKKRSTKFAMKPNVVQTKDAECFTKSEPTPPTSSNPLMESHSSMGLHLYDHETMVREIQSGAESRLSMDLSLNELLASDFSDSELWKLLDGGIEQQPLLFSDPMVDDVDFNFQA